MIIRHDRRGDEIVEFLPDDIGPEDDVLDDVLDDDSESDNDSVGSLVDFIVDDIDLEEDREGGVREDDSEYEMEINGDEYDDYDEHCDMLRSFLVDLLPQSSLV